MRSSLTICKQKMIDKNTNPQGDSLNLQGELRTNFILTELSVTITKVLYI